jgi:diadenylate cyclase
MGTNAKSEENELKTAQGATQSAEKVTFTLLRHVGQIAEECGATAIFVYVDALNNEGLSLPEALEEKVCYVTKTLTEARIKEERGERYVKVPNVPLTRTGQVKIALFLALSRGLVKRGDKIVFLSGIAASGNLDTIIVTEVGREYEMLTTPEGVLPGGVVSQIQPGVIERVIEIASELGIEGREGKPLGALFVVGDTDKVLSLTRQLILNPFRGYPEESRSILDTSLEETIKELASIDGAFIVRGDGVIESCGTYLKTASQEEFELPRGLGARHHAAAAITSLTDAISVTVSESTGTVTIFRGGGIVTEIEKPRVVSRKAAPSGAYTQKATPEPTESGQ